MRDVNRVAKVIASGQRGVDPVADLFLEEELPDLCKEVRRICQNKIERIYMEAALLASDDIAAISRVLGFPEPVIELYEKAYYNVQGASRIERAWLVDSCLDQYEQNMKRWSFSQGLDFLAWRLGVRVEMSPVEGISSLYADCYFKAKEAFFNPNSSEASKEALKWTKQASELSRILKAWVSNQSEALKDIELALKNVGVSDVFEDNDITKLREENGEELSVELPNFGDIESMRRDNEND